MSDAVHELQPCLLVLDGKPHGGHCTQVFGRARQHVQTISGRGHPTKAITGMSALQGARCTKATCWSTRVCHVAFGHDQGRASPRRHLRELYTERALVGYSSANAEVCRRPGGDHSICTSAACLSIYTPITYVMFTRFAPSSEGLLKYISEPFLACRV